MTNPSNFDAPEERASKSRRKRDMLALQKLGEQLTQLKPQQLAQIPLDETLREAITELENIHQREGRRRHLQFIGKLMRNSDHEAIRAALEHLQHQGHQLVQQQRRVEEWRDRLLSDDQSALPAFVEMYRPDDIQQLRQLIRQAQKEQQNNKPPASARKLFRVLSQTMERQN